jgi:hypothetical protein
VGVLVLGIRDRAQLERAPLTGAQLADVVADGDPDGA